MAQLYLNVIMVSIATILLPIFIYKWWMKSYLKTSCNKFFSIKSKLWLFRISCFYKRFAQMCTVVMESQCQFVWTGHLTDWEVSNIQTPYLLVLFVVEYGQCNVVSIFMPKISFPLFLHRWEKLFKLQSLKKHIPKLPWATFI